MNQPDVKETVLETGATPVGDSPAEFEAFMAKERQRLGDVITRSRDRADGVKSGARLAL